MNIRIAFCVHWRNKLVRRRRTNHMTLFSPQRNNGTAERWSLEVVNSGTNQKSLSMEPVLEKYACPDSTLGPSMFTERWSHFSASDIQYALHSEALRDC